MDCRKFEDFDKDDPRYQILVDAIENGSVKLFEDQDECKAMINRPPSQLEFMEAYLESQGYKPHRAWFPESQP